jgi:hypothetical protein
MADSGKHIQCVTRALKNARYLKRVAPETFGRDPSADCFGTGLPMDILIRLHRLRHDSAELRSYPDVSEFLKTHTMPLPQRIRR